MLVNFYVVDRGGARASVLVTYLRGGFPHLQILNHKLGLWMMNLVTKAATKPAPFGSITVGIAKATEKSCVTGLVVAGTSVFQGCDIAFCVFQVMPRIGADGPTLSYGPWDSEGSMPSKPENKPAVLP